MASHPFELTVELHTSQKKMLESIILQKMIGILKMQVKCVHSKLSFGLVFMYVCIRTCTERERIYCNTLKRLYYGHLGTRPCP